ncbi:MAG: chemotaxis protein CheY [Sulfurovum sp. PC08-66]|nr:MAG: chemotaxis protein CheY [Sulfurovum sp. PC08-66]KIM12360.1 MAG: chemotaxis protein CheY [Sulfuricurvum sp. PC08-66]
MKRILLIEDDVEFAEILSEFLVEHGLYVAHEEDPYLALSRVKIDPFDLVILDLTLPGLDGLEVCKEIVKGVKIPVIISSARSDIKDKIEALEIGADDYLPKPYDARELLARINSVFRRLEEKPKSGKIKDITIEKEKRMVLLQNKRLQLTSAEYEIMAYFLQKEGHVISRQELINNIESIAKETGVKSIDVIIGRIRQKLGDDPKNPKYIHSIRGVGYQLIQ